MRTATLALPLLAACFTPQKDDGPVIAEQTLTLTSADFKHQAGVPKAITCEGADRSPELSWSGVPKGTESFVIIVDDPDAPDPLAPEMTWTHWVVYDIPKNVRSLPAGATELPAGTQVGTNSWGKKEYGGPCPPIGRHRYFHKLYALSRPVGDMSELSPEEVAARIAPAVIGRTELVGTYEKTGVIEE